MTEEIELNKLTNNNTDIHNIRKGFSYVSSKKIDGAINSNSMFWAICEGKRGIGKSSYCLYVLYDIFLNRGYNKTGAWDMALQHTLFTIPEILNFLKTSVAENREKVFLWDDAGVFGSNLRWFTHIKEISLLQSLMDTIRTSVNGCLLTCPNQFQLLKFLRRYDGFCIQIHYDEPKGHWYRVAKGYGRYQLPSGKQLVYHKFNDYYYCRLPQAVYKKYMEKRESYNRDNIASLEEMMNRKKGVRYERV